MSTTSSDLSTSDLEGLLDFAIKLARRAGKVIVESSVERSRATAAADQAVSATESKQNRVDLVTATDQAVEELIKQSIAEAYPSHAFIGEESFAGGASAVLGDEPTWIVDPIGTTNFVHGFDHVACSIGFTYKQVPVIGVIYNPFLDKLYSALVGHGAYLNESRRLPLSHPSPPAPLASLSDAMIATEWGSDRSKRAIEAKGATFMRLAGEGGKGGVEGGVMAHALRSIGSAALNYSYVAAGQLDLYFEIGCWSWDVCAGTIIAREAGAKVYGRGGKEFEPQDLMGHHFFVVRAIGDTPTESGADAQARIAKEYFAAAEDWE